MKLNIPGLLDFYIRGTLVHLCADSKGAHELHGFLSPSANMFCRQCLIHKAAIRQHVHIRSVEMRTVENYKEIVRLLSDSECDMKKQAISQRTGVNHACVLNKLTSFHPANNHCFDASHDFFEGMCPCLLKLCFFKRVSDVKKQFELNLN